MGREVTLEEMRELQLDMLKKVHHFCVEKRLRYSLGGGTLLGAVRHKGYIPWDDDVDIMMPRPDYERFIKEFDGQFENIAVQHYKNDESYPLSFAKLYDNRTFLADKFSVNGVYMDVFPLDGVPETVDLSQYYKSFYRKLAKVLDLSPLNEIQKKVFYPDWKSKIRCLYNHLFYGSRNENIEKLEQFLNSFPFDDCVKVGCVTGSYGEREIMSSHVFKSYVLLPFEGCEFYCIKEYDAYLKAHYGDYMKLPPIEKQITHHDYVVYWK